MNNTSILKKLRFVPVLVAALFSMSIHAHACKGCGVPHIGILSANPQALQSDEWFNILRKRNMTVHFFAGSESNHTQLQLLAGSRIIIIDGAPSAARQWSSACRKVVGHYLDSGNTVMILWPADSESSDPVVPLETRLLSMIGAIGSEERKGEQPTIHPNHRGKSHEIARGVDLETIPRTLSTHCKLGACASPVLTLGTDAPIAWTSAFRLDNGRFTKTAVVQAASRTELSEPAYQQLIANTYYWSIDLWQHIPLHGVPIN